MLTLFGVTTIFAQSDSLVFYNGNTLSGEIKSMQKGVLQMNVSFDDVDFKIKWLDIKEIYTVTKFVVRVNNDMFEGKLASTEDQQLKVFNDGQTLTECKLEDVVYMIPYKDGFVNRFSAEVEVGFNLAKAQDLRQFSVRSGIGYKTRKYELNLSYNMLRSSQTSVETVERTDALLKYQMVLVRNWYGSASINTLSNTEQKIDLRANTLIGVGNYLFYTNQMYWGVQTGINNNLERFASSDLNRNTWEAVLSTELNLFDISDFDLSFSFIGYSGITESGRFRADTNLDLKYDIISDLFIRFGFALNFDNRPAENASNTDYILQTGIGWEF